MQRAPRILIAVAAAVCAMALAAPSAGAHATPRGTWGVGIFADDLALDVRAEFRELTAAGFTPEAATDRILADYELTRPVDRYEGLAWLGLAVTQWRSGRVVAHVRDTALRVIERELARPLFRGPDRARRRAVLLRTREQLTGPSPPPRPVRPAPTPQSPFRPGDILRYTMTSGRQVAFWAMYEERSQSAVRETVNTAFRVHAVGDPELPPFDELVRRPSLSTGTAGGRRVVLDLFLHLPQRAVGPAWQVIGNVPFPQPDTFQPSSFTVFSIERGRLPDMTEQGLDQWLRGTG